MSPPPRPSAPPTRPGLPRGDSEPSPTPPLSSHHQNTHREGSPRRRSQSVSRRSPRRHHTPTNFGFFFFSKFKWKGNNFLFTSARPPEKAAFALRQGRAFPGNPELPKALGMSPQLRNMGAPHHPLPKGKPSPSLIVTIPITGPRLPHLVIQLHSCSWQWETSHRLNWGKPNAGGFARYHTRTHHQHQSSPQHSLQCFRESEGEIFLPCAC